MEVDKGVLGVSIYESSLLKFGVEGERGQCRSGSAVSCHSGTVWYFITLLWGSQSKCRRCCSCGEAELCPQTLSVPGCALVPNLRGTSSLCSQPPLCTKDLSGREDTEIIFSGSLTHPEKGAVVSHASWLIWPQIVQYCMGLDDVQIDVPNISWDLIPAEHIPATPLNLQEPFPKVFFKLFIFCSTSGLILLHLSNSC